MTFNDNVQLDTSQATSGGSSGGGYGGGGNFPGGIQVGGGIGGLILLILIFIFGGNVLDGGGTQDPGTGTSTGQSSSLDPSQVAPGGSQVRWGVRPVQDGGRREQERRVPRHRHGQQRSGRTGLRRSRSTAGSTRRPTPCSTPGRRSRPAGPPRTRSGPFYCPLDKLVYIDASFFQELQQRFGANGGNLAKEYVVAHEYGHHIQDILGLLGRAQQDPQGPESGSVRLELMADCLAGMWVKNATQTKDANGVTYLKPITQEDIASALSAASAVGDDRIQKATQGRVNPESWTHGSSAQRQKWFTTGYQTGDLNQCNTFAAQSL